MSAKKLVILLPLLAVGFDYPVAHKGDTVDDYHGTRVADPYRWLEDSDSPDTRAWIEAENKLTFGFLAKLPARERFRARLGELQNYERFDVPVMEGGRIFYDRNSGLQNQDVLYSVPGKGGEPRMLLDPNTLAADGTVAVTDVVPSRDGRRVLYALGTAGSDWREVHVRDVDSGKDLPDLIRWVKFSSLVWTRDGKGFYYAAYDAPRAGSELTGANYFQKLFYHRLGTTQDKDELVLESREKKEWRFGPTVSDDDRYLVVTIARSSSEKRLLRVKDRQARKPAWIELTPDFEETAYIGNIGTRFFLITRRDAPRGRVVSVDLGSRDRTWKTVVPEERSVIDGDPTLVADTLVVNYLDDAQSRVSLFATDGKKLRDVPLPGIGSVSGWQGHRDDKETFYSFESFTVPRTIYRYDFTTGESSVFRQPKVAFDPSAFETRRVFVTSKDGTRLPLFITARKGTPPDSPTILYGYGGFNNSATPSFKVSTLVWAEAGGVFANAVLRGDGAYGTEFHEAGMREHKQNVFDDFIADAEYLIREKVTSTPKLAVQGGSNGGLLVGAVVNQRPELFGAALPSVGVMDMLRYHRYTIGWAWAEEYGSSDDPQLWRTLLAYSPLHNIKAGTRYPATFITTADHDDRVVPAHSFKYAATLQAAQGGPAPILIRIETRAGHGGGKPVSKQLEEAADRLAFTSWALKMTAP